MIKCNQCSKLISDKANKCIYCGYSKQAVLIEANPNYQNLPQPDLAATANNQVYANNIQINNITQSFDNTNYIYGASYFDGGLLQYIGWNLLGTLVTTITLGICFPWALCMVYGWKINHTVVCGRRLKFTGTAMSLFGNWIKWVLLCVITLGIYSFWLFIALEKWKVKNTVFY